jgi:tRNA (guanine-N7-)-methyltransferase
MRQRQNAGAVPVSGRCETPLAAAMDDGRSRRGAFFGRRQGHKLSPRQAGLFETLLPRLALDLAMPPGDLSRLFSAPVDSVRLEIGFGGGEYLLAEAQQQPRTGFIGIEPFVNAADVIGWLPPAGLACVDLVYPDPWPKRRHWKRRFVQDASLAELARVLRPGGEFRFVTDIPDYASWTLERGLRSPDLVWTAERADDWRLPWRGFTGTRYEAKAKGEGRCPCYLIFRRR